MRGIHRLKALDVQRASDRGMYADGGGLYLQVSKSGSKSWIFRYQIDRRPREMGLGPFPVVSLAEARERAAAVRKVKVDGKDPIDQRRQDRAAKRLAAARAVTFQAAAERYIASHKAGWKNPVHAAQWPSTLSMYVYPLLGSLPVAEVDTGLVTKVLEPLWTKKPETAARVRGRIEAVLDWARAHGYRTGENPARWRGHLDKLLPARSKVQKVKHHAALPFVELPAFMRDLPGRDGVAPRALEFLILTGARTGEVIGATWSEIDLDAKVWTIPAERMKGKREHRVPLSERAADLLRKLDTSGPAVFCGARKDGHLSNMAMTEALREMGRGDITVHGFRSTFRDWASERTAYPREVAEMALAHAISDKVEAAYRRGDLFEKRRRLMADWAAYCATPPAAPANNVRPIGLAAVG